MVQRAPSALALDQDEFQRRVVDREVRVSGTHLGRRGSEELPVELDRLVEAFHVDRQLHSAHRTLLSSMAGTRADTRSLLASTAIDMLPRRIDACQYLPMRLL